VTLRTTLRVVHFGDGNIVSKLSGGHALRADENELSADTVPRSFNHHPHADVPVDIVHEDVKLVQASDG